MKLEIDERDLKNMMRHMFLIGLNSGPMTEEKFDSDWESERDEAVDEIIEEFKRDGHCDYN